MNYENSEIKHELFHSDLQLIHEWGSAEWSFLEKIKNKKQNLKLLTFHLASCCEKPYMSKGVFQLGGREYSRDEMKYFAKNNSTKIKNMFDDSIDIAIENNNYYPTPAYRDITDANFISEVVKENNIKFLFDIAHAKITCFNKNINFEKYKRDLPLDKIIQIHICAHKIDNKLNQAYDAHNFPNDEEFLEVSTIVTEYKDLKYLTIEYYRDIKNLEVSLIKFKNLINSFNVIG